MRPKQAKLAAKTCLLLASSIMPVRCGALILALRRQLGNVFTSDAAVIQAVVATAPLLAALQVTAH
jgi:Na+-driven multidrug efflux pump